MEHTKQLSHFASTIFIHINTSSVRFINFSFVALPVRRMNAQPHYRLANKLKEERKIIRNITRRQKWKCSRKTAAFDPFWMMPDFDCKITQAISCIFFVLFCLPTLIWLNSILIFMWFMFFHFFLQIDNTIWNNWIKFLTIWVSDMKTEPFETVMSSDNLFALR